MTSITFSGRIPAPQMCFVGMKGEHNAEVIAFAGLPAMGEGQTEILNLMLPDGTADAIEIIDGQITLTRDHTPQPGTLLAWAEIHVGTEIVWKSEKIRLIIDTLPDADGEIEKQYPTAFEQAIAQTGANVVAAEAAQEAAETAQGKAEDAQDAAEAAQGKAEDAQDAAEAARDVILGMTATAETLEPGSPATVDYHEGVMAFGIPRGADGQDGQDGEDGYSPSASVTKSGDTVTITITDKSGTTTAEVTSPQIDVATEAETREIIDEYREDADMIFETVFYDEPSVEYISAADAADIAAAFKAGKGVMVHLPGGEGPDIYGIHADMYLRMVAYQDGYTWDGNTVPDSYEFTEGGIYTQGGSGFNLLSEVSVGTDGKLHFLVIVD